MKPHKLFYNISKVKENIICGTPFSRRGYSLALRIPRCQTLSVILPL